jgi:hypothetical protein
MSGKGAILIVIAFMMSFSYYQLRLSRAVLSATDNFNYYFVKTVVHQSALSAMNIGINKVWAENITSANFNVVINQCTSAVSIFKSGTDTVKVKVKTWGYAYVDTYYTKYGKPYKIEDSVIAYFAYSMPVSKYFWFTHIEGYVYWITGDTVWGPVHTNGVLRTHGRPVFYGKVTAGTGISPNPMSRGSRAKFYGGWEVGVTVDVPTDVSHLEQAASDGNAGAPVNTKSIYNKVTLFEFLPDGRVVRQVGTIGGTFSRSSDAYNAVNLSDIAPTGAIHVQSDVLVKGVLNGQVTILSDYKIWIWDDIVYADDPTVNPNSDDLLGLVAKEHILVADNAQNNNDVNIQACLMAANGSFTAEAYDRRPVSGELRITGSIVQYRRGAIGMFSRWTGSIVHGFSKRYKFDPRLKAISPPNYPYVRELRLVAWWE